MPKVAVGAPHRAPTARQGFREDEAAAFVPAAEGGNVTPPSPAAPTRSGTICANTPIRVSIARQPMIAREAQAAGGVGLTIVPSGRMIESGRR